ncbi:MAG TPA: phosphodiester glycosidase family protein [Chitinophagales bacterium]|nr:phosphodiester glycosidase family protein [Chitinophagales bacterium]
MNQIAFNFRKSKINIITFTLILFTIAIFYVGFNPFHSSNKNNILSSISEDQNIIDTIESNKDTLDLLVKKVNTLGKLLVRVEESENKSLLKNKLHHIEEDKKQINHLQAEINQIIQNNTSSLSFNFNYKANKYSCFILNTNSEQHEINFHLKSNSGIHYESISNLYNTLNSDTTEVLMITNAGMYLQNLDPQGLLIENSTIVKKLNLIKSNNNTNFYMFPNGVFALDTNLQAIIMETDSFSKNVPESQIKHATQSGPMLLIDGKIHPKFINGSKNLNIRSGVGISSENHSNILFIISNSEVNFYDFASVYKNLFNCDNALYLDGAISQMYLKEFDKDKIPAGHFGPLISVIRKK